MLISGVITVVLLTCSGLFFDKWLHLKPVEDDLSQFFDGEAVPELGIQPKNVRKIQKKIVKSNVPDKATL